MKNPRSGVERGFLHSDSKKEVQLQKSGSIDAGRKKRACRSRLFLCHALNVLTANKILGIVTTGQITDDHSVLAGRGVDKLTIADVIPT